MSEKLTEAMKEAYASPEYDEVVIDTLQLDHASFERPIYIACNVPENIPLPIVEYGPLFEFVAMGIKITPPSFDDDGMGSAQVQIDNVSGLLERHARAAVQGGTPILVTYRAYTSSDLNQPGEVYSGMLLKRVSLTATMATGTLEMPEHETQAFPRLTYSVADYPALHGQS